MEAGDASSPWAGQRDLGNRPPKEQPSRSPGWYPHPEEPEGQRYWDGNKWGKHWVDQQDPGWLLKDGTLRYFDGSDWTDHIAPPQPKSLTTRGIAGAVFLGVTAALFLVWLGAQISPEHVYLPVKFVVKELPNF